MLFTFLHNVENMPAVVNSVKSVLIRYSMENKGAFPSPDQVICHETTIENEKPELLMVTVVKYDKKDGSKFQILGTSRTHKFKHLTPEQTNRAFNEAAEKLRSGAVKMLYLRDYDDFFRTM